MKFLKATIKFIFENIVKLFNITFSISGPIIISFGTFSGLLTFFEIFFIKIEPTNYMFVYITYLVSLYFLAWFAETQSKNPEVRISVNSDDGQNPLIQEAIRKLKNQQYLRVILSGGISKLIDYLLEKNEITFYDYFKRPTYWKSYPDNQKENPIFRFIKNKRSIEVRFPKNNPRKVLVRETLPNSNNYGEFKEESLWDWKFLFVLTPIRFILQIFG